jgi:hypothetical protein
MIDLPTSNSVSRSDAERSLGIRVGSGVCSCSTPGTVARAYTPRLVNTLKEAGLTEALSDG